MTNNLRFHEVYLRPGDFWFGERNHRLRTLLGSCVAIILWHPRLLVGGMCHYVLPERMKRDRTGKAQLDGRYADEAVQLFLRELNRNHTRPEEYQVKVFGAGNMFPRLVGRGRAESECVHVACRNAQAAKQLLKHYGFIVVAQDLEGSGYRSITFDVWSGELRLRRGEKAEIYTQAI